METAEIGIFGGTGVYDSGLLEDAEEVEIDTPYGSPSDSITVGTFGGKRVAFLPRHGKGHQIPPHLINFRANIYAFQSMGITRVIAPSAVGSLQKEIEPMHFALPSQFFDFTKSRHLSFSEKNRVIHISVADPFCPELQACVRGAAEKSGVTMHKDCTYVCIEGPRFSTRAESGFYRSAGGHVIGMTLVPECQLAREAQMCYVSIASVTDYDVWAERAVTAKEVLSNLNSNVEHIKQMLKVIVKSVPERRACACARALEEAQF